MPSTLSNTIELKNRGYHFVHRFLIKLDLDQTTCCAAAAVSFAATNAINFDTAADSTTQPSSFKMNKSTRTTVVTRRHNARATVVTRRMNGNWRLYAEYCYLARWLTTDLLCNFDVYMT